MKSVEVIGVASRLGARNAHSELGPNILHQSSFSADVDREFGVHLHWRSTLYPADSGVAKDKIATHQSLASLCKTLSGHTEELTKARTPFVVIGGDHSYAMGTWAGVMNAFADTEKFGLIWIDAHLDAHTFATSPSGNIHGMPVAALLGAGDQSLQELCPAKSSLKANNLLMLGIRSFESEERDLLLKLKVNIFCNDDLKKQPSFPLLFKHLVDQASAKWDHFGISIDLDGIDPEDAPAVATPVAGGILASDLCAALRGINNCKKLIGIEIAEYEPTNDQASKTQQVIRNIIGAVYGEKSNP